MLGAARVDAHERQAVARRAVGRREHLVVGDEEVRGASDAGLDLDADWVLAVAAGEDVEAWVVERLLDRGAAEPALASSTSSTPRRSTSFVSTACTGASSGISVSTAARGSTSAAVTTRGGLACISDWRSSSASRAVRRLSRSAALYIRLVWLSGLLAGLLLLLGDHRLEARGGCSPDPGAGRPARARGAARPRGAA